MIDTKEKLKEVLLIEKKSYSFKMKLYHFIYPNKIDIYIRLLRKYTFYHEHGNKIQKAYAYYLYYKLMKLSYKLGFYIPRDVFGSGVYIPHFGSIVINPHTKIGKNCQINNNVVIGQVGGKAPVIGDNCYIGPGVVISGDVKIGNNIWIGANSVVTKSFMEDNVLIAGVPAKIICVRGKNWVEIFNQE